MILPRSGRAGDLTYRDLQPTTIPQLDNSEKFTVRMQQINQNYLILTKTDIQMVRTG